MPERASCVAQAGLKVCTLTLCVAVFPYPTREDGAGSVHIRPRAWCFGSARNSHTSGADSASAGAVLLRSTVRSLVEPCTQKECKVVTKDNDGGTSAAARRACALLRRCARACWVLRECCQSRPLSLWFLFARVQTPSVVFVLCGPLFPRWARLTHTTIVIWLILPVVIRLSQRLSHACLSINSFVR